jgi:transposase
LALKAKPIPGRPAKVSEEEMRWIAQTVRDKTPQQMKLEFELPPKNRLPRVT